MSEEGAWLKAVALSLSAAGVKMERLASAQIALTSSAELLHGEGHGGDKNDATPVLSY